MILLFIFCLYYVLHERHHRVITPNFPSSLNNPLGKKPLDYQSLYLTKSQFIGFSDYRFIVCLILLILLGLMAIPIGGLTGFHMYLISRGRTTNEQVTGKYQVQNDVFNYGCWKNFCWTFCQPLYPKLQAPKKKRFDQDIFEMMAYGTSSNMPMNSNDEKRSIESSICST